MLDARTKRIYLVRHAQAVHNVVSDWDIADANLTRIGRLQATRLHPATRDTLQQTAELLVSSPLRRTMETTLLAFPDLKSRLEAERKQGVVLLDLAQEVSDLPCDTPTFPLSELEESNDAQFRNAGLDFSTLSPDYATKQGIFDPDRAAERARVLRQWLRDRPEREIVLVAHGDILRYMVDGYHSSRKWNNTEVREFGFASQDDGDALLVERDSVTPSPASSVMSSSPTPSNL
ncbi:hypothetical protein Q8F55_002540 [Vanrija albida]|uniref:Phosphoglycerate mutase-like protein n=1 Tax=Vanrija albida TaxID=181172 RepID=A0ABR3QA76_9TREE